MPPCAALQPAAAHPAEGSGGEGSSDAVPDVIVVPSRGAWPHVGRTTRLADLPLDGLAEWLEQATEDPGPFRLEPLGEGATTETLRVRSPAAEWVLRRPPRAPVADRGAPSIERLYRLTMALADTHVPVARPLAVCVDAQVAGAPFLLMRHVDGVSVSDRLPDAYPRGPEPARAVGEALVDVLADVHSLPWRDLGLHTFGRPDGFLERQVERWSRHYHHHRHRELPEFDAVARWLALNRPPDGEPGILHGDFQAGNCLISPQPPARVEAVVDWDMATIGDPLLDGGLFLGLWGSERARPIAMPPVQGFSRIAGAPTRAELVERYERRSGRSLEHLDYYMALAFWKLAAIAEGPHAQFVAGRLDPRRGAALELDVPRLLAEARAFAGF